VTVFVLANGVNQAQLNRMWSAFPLRHPINVQGIAFIATACDVATCSGNLD
jgi:hypothetical protein